MGFKMKAPSVSSVVSKIASAPTGKGLNPSGVIGGALGQAGEAVSDVYSGAFRGKGGLFENRENAKGGSITDAAAAAAAAARQQMLKDMPQLGERVGSASLGESGRFKASTIAQSPWEALAQRKQGLDQSMAGDALARSNAMQAAQGRGAAMMAPGASTAAGERAGLAGMQGTAQKRLALMAQGGQQRQAIAQQGGAKGLDIAQFNASQNQQANQANVGQSIKDLGQQNAFNQLKYGEQMRFVGGQNTGTALDKANGGKK